MAARIQMTEQKRMLKYDSNSCESTPSAKIYFIDKKLADIREIYDDLFGNNLLKLGGI